MRDIVIYHGNCVDGLTAAAVHYLLKRDPCDPAIYIPMQYNDPLPEICEGETNGERTIYILDFSLPAETLLRISEKSKVVLLDHHKTTIELLDRLVGRYKNLVIKLDISKSGAMMAYCDFTNRWHEPDTAPPFVRYVQDKDLWRFDLYESKEVNAFIGTINRNVKDYADHIRLSSKPGVIDSWRSKGAAILAYQNNSIDTITSMMETTEVKLNGVICEIPCCNSPILQSETGNRLAKKYGMACVYFVKGDKYIVSLRSVGDIDVSEIAKLNGGGGHRNAAGFSLEATEPFSIDNPKIKMSESVLREVNKYRMNLAMSLVTD